MRTAHKGMKRIGLLLVILLVMFGMVFGTIAEEGGAADGTSERNGSKIEGVKVIWVTQDSETAAEDDPMPQAELDKKDHLYLSSVSIEVGIRGVRLVDVVDMSEMAPITAQVEVVTNQGNTIALTSDKITAQLDTQAQIDGAY